MHTEQNTFALVMWLVAGLALSAFLIVALRKARARRREELGSDRVEALAEAHAKEIAARRVAAEKQHEEARDGEKPVPASEAAPPADVIKPTPAPEFVAASAPALAPVPEQAVEQAPETAAIAEPIVITDAVLQRGLAKTHASLMARLGALFGRPGKIDQAVLDELEEILLTADVGVRLAGRMVSEVREELKRTGDVSAETVRQALKDRMLATLEDASAAPWSLNIQQKPYVILFVGVNGVGKTTTIGKIAKQLGDQGHSVVLAAGDTFRAAAAEQLTVWGERSGAKVIRGEAGSDPASVVFNALTHAKQAGADVVLADTAGRLHTKVELMDEIKKVKRALSKAREGAPDETWLVVDGTTGQNALHQAREFHEALGLTGVILTKLDGTAKGGVVVAIADALKIPVRFVGVGEQADDLRPFSGRAFVHALFDAA